VSLSCRLNSP